MVLWGEKDSTIHFSNQCTSEMISLGKQKIIIITNVLQTTSYWQNSKNFKLFVKISNLVKVYKHFIIILIYRL